MQYTVEILDSKGGSRMLVHDAQDRNHLMDALRTMLAPGESIIEIREANEKKASKKPKRISLDLLTDLCYDLAELLESGQPMTKACDILQQTNTSPVIAGLLGRVKDRLSRGAELTQVFEAEKHLVGDVFVALVAQGDSTKNLPGAFRTMAAIFDRDVKRKATLINELAMPLLAMCVGFVVFLGSFIVIVPMTREQMGSAKPNMISQTAFMISDFLRGYPFWWGSIFVLAIFVLIRFPKIRNSLIYYFIVKWSVARRAFMTVYYADFCLIFGSLVANGIKDVDALRITARRFVSIPLGSQLLESAKRCDTGVAIFDSLQANTTLDPRVLAAVKTSSEAKNLGPYLETYSGMLYFRADRAFAKFSRLFTVAVILITMLFALFIWLVSYAPIWQSLQAQINGQV